MIVTMGMELRFMFQVADDTNVRSRKILGHYIKKSWSTCIGVVAGHRPVTLFHMSTVQNFLIKSVYKYLYFFLIEASSLTENHF